MFTLRSLWLVMQQQQITYAHYPVKSFGIHRWLSLCATLLAPDAPLASINITRLITDNVEDRRQYFCVCFVITTYSFDRDQSGMRRNMGGDDNMTVQLACLCQ
ncbi:hypothetical protein CWM86_32410 [Klebsiella pneumoniae]|nr:hypothetical protein CWM86_32410 [Klebsiella pneumoniae]